MKKDKKIKKTKAIKKLEKAISNLDYKIDRLHLRADFLNWRSDRWYNHSEGKGKIFAALSFLVGFFGLVFSCAGYITGFLSYILAGFGFLSIVAHIFSVLISVNVEADYLIALMFQYLCEYVGDHLCERAEKLLDKIPELRTKISRLQRELGHQRNLAKNADKMDTEIDMAAEEAKVISLIEKLTKKKKVEEKSSKKQKSMIAEMTEKRVPLQRQYTRTEEDGQMSLKIEKYIPQNEDESGIGLDE